MSDIDVVEKVLADQPDLPVHVPYAGNTSPGIASFNTRDFIVEEDGAVQLSKDVQALTEQAVQAAANAKQSEQNAAESEANAKQSETNAKQSETNAKQSENKALQYRNEAEGFSQDAADSASQAMAARDEIVNNHYVERAEQAADEAEAALNNIVTNDYVGKAEQAANDAKQSVISAGNEADRAELAADKAEQVVAGIGTVYKPQGSLAFASLPAQPAEQYQGFVWNITNAFVTDDRFLEGAGQDVAAGANVACVYDNGQYKYDLLGNFIDVSKFSAVVDLGTFNKINDDTYTKALSTEIRNALKENNIAMMVSFVEDSNTCKLMFCDYARLANEALILNATILNVGDNGLFTHFELSIEESAAVLKISEVDLSNYYIKPSTGIPKSDLASAVQTSLGKADTALQSIPIATQSAVGGVKPATKTSEMTQEVGVDSNGALWTVPAASGGIEQNEVIAVESLPTATADSPDFVQTLDGKLYRKKSSQTNGIDTTKLQGTWKLKTTSNVSGLTNFNTDMTASASAVAHAFDEDLFGFIFSGQTFNTFNYYIEEFTLYGSGTWQIKDDIEFYAAADNLSYKTELLAMMNQCYTKQTSSIITTYSYEEVGASGNGVVDLGSLREGANTISSELSQKIMDESCTIVKFELSNVVGQDIYCTRSIEVPTENGVAFTFTMADDDNTIRTYGITVKGTTVTLMILDVNAGGTTVEFATVDECAEAFNPTAVTLISFKVANNTYTAESGMTWQQFVDSNYNENGAFSISGIYVYWTGNMILSATSDDTIISGMKYSLSSGGTAG